jgi:5-methylthioadenosine/S-adenosylhomocysteine deaminase
MPTSLIRGRRIVTRATSRHAWNEIADGAILQRDGIIETIGPFEDLARHHPHAEIIGDGTDIVLPGFVNAHHHVGLTPTQLGAPDSALELWWIARMVCRGADPYLDTMYSAFDMIASGVTTVQHIHGWVPGPLKTVENTADSVIRAYTDIGMRVSYSHAVRNQNRLVYQDDQAFLASLPADLRPALQRWFNRFELRDEDHIALFQSLHGRHQDSRRTRIQLAPANLHWCSDTMLAQLAETAERYDVPLHMHLLETAYQKQYAHLRAGHSAVDHIARFNLLGPRMTIGHGVWLSESDIGRLAETGTCVCHNCSSNFRLRSGIAPLNALQAAGIPTAIGIDEAGMDDSVPTAAQVFRMATEGGAQTTPFGTTIGTLAPGKAADIVMLDWQQISYPYLDPAMPLLDAVLARAKTAGVRRTICDGEVIYEEGRFTRVDRDAALKTLHESLTTALTQDEQDRRDLSKHLMPHIQAFYATYIDPARHDPFYRSSAKS